MPDQYDVNFNQQIIEILPPNKRYINTISFFSDLMTSGVQYLRDAVLGDYRNGSTAAAWSAGTYARGAKVTYKKGIYVSLSAGNSDIPGLTDKWYLQQTFFIGLDERLAYNGNNLVLTYALNRWFGTTFRQPGTGLSDIYITTNPIDANTFIVGFVSSESSVIGWTNSEQAITYNSSFGVQYNANVYVPAAVFAALGDAAMALIRSFVDMYVYSGVIYQVITYV